MNIKHHFRNKFEPELLEELEQKSMPMQIPPGETVLDVGDNIKVNLIVSSGSVKVLRNDNDGRELFLYQVSPDESCVMTFTCCMQHWAREIKAVTDEKVELLAFPIDLMDKWMQNMSPGEIMSWKPFS